MRLDTSWQDNVDYRHLTSLTDCLVTFLARVMPGLSGRWCISEVTAQAKAYPRAKYMNSEEQLVCQCCHLEMPFKLPSGDHYFEAVQCIQDAEVRHFQNRLALCPTCAAMYQYARETEDEAIRSSLVDHPADDQAPSIEIAVRLAGQDKTLHFVGTHWFDLKTVLAHGSD